MKGNGIKNASLAVVLCAALLLAGCDNQAGFYVERQEDAGLDTHGGTEVSEVPEESSHTPSAGQGSGEMSEGHGGDKRASDESGDTGDSSPDEIYVQISGAVMCPGVYKLPAGSRIFEAVELAGGITPEADLSSVNQAEMLSDGQMVYIYAVGEEWKSLPGQTTGESKTGDGKVNINTASEEELLTLPGIGLSKAEDIISWRETNGPFDCVEDIMNIRGIKEGVFSKIEDRIKVD